MYKKSDFHVGQELFVVRNAHRSPRTSYEKITKIGRKWLTIGDGYWRQRVDIETLAIDGEGFASPGLCYLNEGQYLTSVRLSRGWLYARGRIINLRGTPDNLTDETLATLNSAIDLVEGVG